MLEFYRAALNQIKIVQGKQSAIHFENNGLYNAINEVHFK
jgi:hypothetical protein